MTLVFAIFTAAFLIPFAGYVRSWAQPKGAFYPTRHFLIPAAICLVLAGVCAWMATL